MALFYFHIRAGDEFIRDPEGTECADADIARMEAMQSVRELIAEALRHGEDPDHRVMQITGRDGNIIGEVQFADILDLK
ncbi:MAG: hypothetical protein WBQ17_16960 [Rhizomicrobium sp.]